MSSRNRPKGIPPPADMVPANRRVMRQFLTTPTLVGTFLFLCGVLGGYGNGADRWRGPLWGGAFLVVGLLFIAVVLLTIRRLFREVLDTKDHLDSILRSMADSLLVVDSDGRISMVNLTALECLGYSAVELEGRPVTQFLRDARGQPLAEGELESIAERNLKELEGTLVGKDEKPLPILVSSARLKDSTGREAGMVYVARDISQRKQAEAQAKLAQLQLMQASKLASLGTIGSGVAHEIKNPLTVVKASAALIRDNPKASRTIREEAAEIVRYAERIHKITDHLLTFARERKEDDWRQVEVNAPIEDSLLLLKAKLKAENIQLKLSLASGLPKIWGDSSQLESVFQNLLTNSIDAFDTVPSERPRRISITTSEREPGMVVVDYEDNASGMPPEVAERIFDPFFTTKSVGKGTGLGMSIMHGVVKKHRGKITLDTEPGRGTHFTIAFPRDRRETVREGAKELPSRKAAPAAKAAPPRSIDPPKVLIVDDEPRIAQLLKQILGKGFQVTIETDSRRACEEIARTRYDLVITDLQMPHVSGLGIVRKAGECDRAPPVLLMSGYGEEDPKVKKAIAEGAAGILDKPFSDPASVRETVGRYLTGKGTEKRRKAA